MEKENDGDTDGPGRVEAEIYCRGGRVRLVVPGRGRYDPGDSAKFPETLKARHPTGQIIFDRGESCSGETCPTLGVPELRG